MWEERPERQAVLYHHLFAQQQEFSFFFFFPRQGDVVSRHAVGGRCEREDLLFRESVVV